METFNAASKNVKSILFSIDEGLECKLVNLAKKVSQFDVIDPCTHRQWIRIPNENKDDSFIYDTFDYQCIDCKFKQLLNTLNIAVISILSRNHKLYIRLLVNSKEQEELFSKMSKIGLIYSILRLSDFKQDNKTMTRKQMSAVSLALNTGYFDYPKKIKLHELAKTLNVKTSTLCETLRRAERAVITEYFELTEETF